MKAPLRIATWNFLAGGSARRKAHWRLVREALRPDLLLAQESRPGRGRAALQRTAQWAEAKRGWGTGLFAPRLVVRPIAVAGFEAWVVGGQLATSLAPPRPTCVFSIHCPQGAHGYVRTMHEILDRIRAATRGADLILGGDLNVAVGVRAPGDAVGMSKRERALLERLLEKEALLPCWQTAHPGEPLAQTLRWSGDRAAPYHCDGLFIPAAWRERLLSCEVLSGPEWDALSDHNPVVAVLRR